MRRVAVVGVGLLGSAVVRRLLAAGFEVAGHDTRATQLSALAASGLRPARSAAEAADGADAIFTILPSLEVVEAVIAGPRGLVAPAPRGATVLQMSTISPPLTRRLGEAAGARGLGFLDTPMSGTSGMVERGDCTIYVGGDPARAKACQPVFDAIARKTVHVGDVGAASLAKLVTNMLVILNTVSLAEALVLGAKGGLDPGRLVEVLKESAGGSRMVDVRGPLMASRRFEPQMTLDLFLKDFKLMIEEGLRLGVPLPLTSLAQQLVSATVASGHAAEDLSAVITTLETMAGLKRGALDPP